ncbi:MAG: ABC transporter permease subunit [Myxococcaceae bacterium]|nr:ABC transporter permease subunit [Myxococcaceae bacterium]
MSPVRLLWWRELTEAIRDRRTVLLMALLPVVLYPLTLLLVGGVMAAGRERLARESLDVAVASDEAAALLARQPVPAFTVYRRMTAEAGLEALREKQVWAVVEASDGAVAALDGRGQAVVTVRYTKRHDRSMEALERLRRTLDAVGERGLTVRLEDLKVTPEFVSPVKVAPEDVDFEKDLGPLIASRLLPVILVLMLFVGALYPAIDMTAGERERGTWETVLVAPVKPWQVMAAKYLAVATLASCTALANLASMAVTFRIGLALDSGQSAQVHFSPAQLAVLLVALVAAAGMVSGVALAVASVARTFKEAQALLTPFTMLGSLPGMLALMPGVELNAFTACVPLLNVALLVKAVVLSAATVGPAALTVASTLVFCGLALRLVAKAAASEAVRFGGGGLRALLGRGPEA